MDCNIVSSEFEHQSHYYVHFWTNTLGKGMNSFISPSIDWIVTLLSFHKDSFDIEKSRKVDMPLNKEAEPVLDTVIWFQVFPPYINHVYSVTWFQVFQAIIWFQVTNNNPL